MRLTDLLGTWPQAQDTSLSGLDVAFAQWLQQRQPSDDARHRWLAALVSHQWSRGHACLDLGTVPEALGWSAVQGEALPAHLREAAANLPWCEGPDSPLVRICDAQGRPHRLYLRRAWLAEQTIRDALTARMADRPTVPADLTMRLDALFGAAAASPDAPPDSPETPPDWQRVACETAARHSVSLITGGPGTGKTTTVVRLLALLLDLATPHTLRIVLAAPTGKAAARLGESIARQREHMPEAVRAHIPTHAQTLHRLLGNGPTPRDLAADVVVVDEASMVDLEMMARLLSSVPASARLVLLGDRDQLASVEAGAVMAQLCDWAPLASHTVTLRHSHRFDAQRGIGQWAAAMQAHGSADALAPLWQHTPTAPDPDADVTRWTHDPSEAAFKALLHQGWHDWLAWMAPHRAGTPCDDDQAARLLHAFAGMGVLCALRDGPHGVLALTRRIERALDMGPPDALGWYVGRPVMVTRNDYALGLMNGDVGLCLPHPAGGWRVAFARAEGGVRWLQPSRLGAIDTVWAMTVHKSQGSEFGHVLLVVPQQDAPLLTRELVYTGITRARARLTLWANDARVLLGACGRQVVRSGGLADTP